MVTINPHQLGPLSVPRVCAHGYSSLAQLRRKAVTLSLLDLFSLHRLPDSPAIHNHSIHSIHSIHPIP